MLPHVLDVLGPGIDERHVLARLHHMGAGIPADGTSSDDSYLPTPVFPLHSLRPRMQPVRNSLEATLADLGLSPNVRFAHKRTCLRFAFDVQRTLMTGFTSAQPPGHDISVAQVRHVVRILCM